MTVTSETHSESTEGGPPIRDSPVAPPAAAFATQRLCPYLVADGSEWRSASPSRDHRCGAVVPPVPLAVDKQRRLCLTNRHVGCPTFLAAANQPGRAVGSRVPDVSARAGRRGRPPGGEAVTRWSIVRTVPVLLDGGRVSSMITSVGRMRSQPQLLLVALLVVAFAAIAAARLSGAGPGTPGAPEPRGSAVAIVPTPAPATPPEATGSSGPPAAATPSPTLPTTANSTRTYKVKSGDTLYVIARRFGTTVTTIQRLNHLGTSTTLHAGQVLKLP